MRISLKDLLAVVGIFAGYSWCASQAGFDNSMFWFAAIVSAAMSVLFVFLSKNPNRRLRALWAIIPIGLFSFLLMSLPLFANALLLTVAIVYLARRPPVDFRTLSFTALVIALISLFIGLTPGFAEIRRLDAMRAEIPIV